MQIIKVLANWQEQKPYIYDQNIELGAQITPSAYCVGFLHKFRNIFQQSPAFMSAAKESANIQNKNRKNYENRSKPHYFLFPSLPCSVDKQVFHKDNGRGQTGCVLFTQKGQQTAKEGQREKG